MFEVTFSKGCRIGFENGWTVSIQWGSTNYCDANQSALGMLSPNAEIAIFTPDDEFLSLGDDDVKGWVTPETVAELLYTISQWSKDITIKTASAEVCEVLEDV